MQQQKTAYANVADSKFDVLWQRQLNFLIYLTKKNMVDYFGTDLIKNIKLPSNIWATIAKKLNVMPGEKRDPKNWALIYAKKKCTTISKFIKFVCKQKDKYGDYYLPDLTKIDKIHMLLLHEYCTQNNFPNVPCITQILKTIEKDNLIDCETLNDDFNEKLHTTLRTNLELEVDSTKIQKNVKGFENLELENCSKGSDLSVDRISKDTVQSYYLKYLSKQKRVHRTSKNTVQSYYLTYLAYLALKRIVNAHGDLYRKNCRLSIQAWNHIAKQMSKETGFNRPAEIWRKTFSSNKYVVQTRFLERLKQNGELNSTVNWSNVRVEELLYLQPLRHEGYPDMPSAEEVLKTYEHQFPLCKNKEFDNNFITPNFVEDNGEEEEEKVFFDNPTIQHENYDIDPVEIKSEIVSDNETFEISEILSNGERRRLDDASFSSGVSNSRPRRKFSKTSYSTKTSPHTRAVDWCEALENEGSDGKRKLDDTSFSSEISNSRTERKFSKTSFTAKSKPVHTRAVDWCKTLENEVNDGKRKLNNASFSSEISNSRAKRKLSNTSFSAKSDPTHMGAEDWSDALDNEDNQQNFESKLNGDKVEMQEPNQQQHYLERRLLEINEKILNEKIKKNKILRKRNKLLKKQTMIFDQMCAKLDILIDKKSV